MSDLWAPARQRSHEAVLPLAARMRPRTIAEFAGQEHILGPGKLLRRMLDAGAVTSMILHGPPGTGKTTLAELIASHTKREFVRENAASVGVKRIREIVDEAAKRLELERRRTVLFLDEIHRFTKSQQDVLLADVERGLITLIGATTENPLFAVNSALVSRSTLFRLESLSQDAIKSILRRAASDPARGYGTLNVTLTDEALEVWATKSDGDARRALTALEVAVESARLNSGEEAGDTPRHNSGVSGPGMEHVHPIPVEGPGGTPPDARVGRQGSEGGRSAGSESARAAEAGSRASTLAPAIATPRPIIITREVAEDSIQQKAIVYDGSGDGHYDTISAFIKSVRGSDPDAAVYWLAHMLEAGEDPRLIARRLSILASEDIGNADPRGIMVAAAAWELVERVGMPESRITLAQATIYLALAPKSNASYVAIDEALKDVREGRTIPVPMHIKDGNVRKAVLRSADSTSPEAQRGQTPQSYAYTHDAGASDTHLGKVGTQDYLGVEKRYYKPTQHGSEKAMGEALERARMLRERAKE
jgi:putative ATPase